MRTTDGVRATWQAYGARHFRNARWLFARLTGRRWGLDQALIEAYFSEYTTRKLHIGCGNNTLDGWLNTDIEPRSARVVALDATATFPYAADSFDLIFSEHMIEHISYTEGRHMLAECYRVLQPGGKLRLSTPDLHFLLDLFRRDKSQLQEQYLRWSTSTFIPGAPYCHEVFVLNNFMRNWGHAFIYNETVLRDALERAGFIDLVRQTLNESADEELRNLETERRLPSGFLALETMVIEAAKPLSPRQAPAT